MLFKAVLSFFWFYSQNTINLLSVNKNGCHVPYPFANIRIFCTTAKKNGSSSTITSPAVKPYFVLPLACSCSAVLPCVSKNCRTTAVKGHWNERRRNGMATGGVRTCLRGGMRQVCVLSQLSCPDRVTFMFLECRQVCLMADKRLAALLKGVAPQGFFLLIFVRFRRIFLFCCWNVVFLHLFLSRRGRCRLPGCGGIRWPRHTLPASRRGRICFIMVTILILTI